LYWNKNSYHVQNSTRKVAFCQCTFLTLSACLWLLLLLLEVKFDIYKKIMNKENDDLIERLGAITRQRKRIKESPLNQGIRELIGEVNREALEGKGEFSAELGEQPTDTIFSLAWEGAITKKQKVRIGDQPFTFLVNPFNLSISSYRTEDGFSGFLVRAKYLPGDSEPVEVGRTGKLDVRELQPIVRGQIPHIKQAAQR